ncbi:MAG: hypothetical protein ABI308_08805, partial [Mucilaginibacter sp.]
MAHQIIITGRLQDRALDETSGIAASGLFKDMYYVHNDSGDTSRFFMITPDGKLHHTIYYAGVNMGQLDCEDIAVGPGPEKQKSYVYLGDIGDNGREKRTVTIYRFQEQPSWQKDSVINARTAKLFLKYPDGPRDAETLMIDPIEKLLCIVSKRGDTVNLYTTPLIYKDNDTAILTPRCKLYFEGTKPFKWITAGDISRDGRHILLKNYEKVYYWKRHTDEHIWQTMQKTPEILPYQVEKQGEAIGFTTDGKGYLTTSEGVFAP